METINNWILQNEILAFYILLASSFIINRIPVIGIFFRSVNTLLHESGHAIMAVLTSGEVMRIEINHDTSGMAQTKNSGKFRAFLTSFAGYPFAALAGSIFLIMSLKGYYNQAAFILLTIIVLNLILFVRNLYGILWLIFFSAGTMFIYQYASEMIMKWFILFVSMISITESITSTLLITYLGFTKPRSSGDLANMQKTSGIPAGFWAMINCGIVILIVYYTVVHYFPEITQIIL